MSNRHLIDGAFFDTRFAEQTVPEEQRSQLDDFIKNNLVDVIAEVFDQVDTSAVDPNYVLRLDNLEIDLGEIPYRDYRQTMPEKLRACLLQALGEMRGTGGDSAHTGGLVSNSADVQSQLFYFLRNGYLPWYAGVAESDNGALEAVLVETVDSSPEFLLEFIRANAERNDVLARLVKQFSPQILVRVLRLLAASRGAAVQQALAQLELMLRQDDDFNDADLESLTAQTPAMEARFEQVTGIDRLHAQLVAALLSGDAVQIASSWASLYGNQAELLEKTIRYYGQRTAVRRHIVSSFSAAQRAELLYLLEPDAHGFVQALMENGQIFLPQTDDQAPRLSGLWEYTMAYLLVERGNEFDPRAYVLGLLRRIVTLNRPRPSTLLNRLEQDIGSLNESGQAGEWLRVLTGLVQSIDPNELIEDSVPDEPAYPIHPPGAIELTGKSMPPAPRELIASRGNTRPSLAASYRRYERIKSALTIVDPDRQRLETELLADIKRLRQDAPWLFMRFFRELQTGSYAWSQVITDLSAPVLAELVYALLSLNHLTDAGRPFGSASELATAIQDRAGSSANPHAFFSYVLSCLINGDLIDLEVTEGRPGSAGQPAERRAVAVDPGDMAERTSTGGLDAEPDLGAMSQRAREQMLLCAELLTTAAYATATTLSPERYDSVKWQFLQVYVTGTGYLFHEAYFARQYIDYLMQQARISDREQFRATLAQALLQNSLAPTQALAQRLIGILGDDDYDIPRPAEPGANELSEIDDEPQPLEEIYIANAGMVLLAPFLPRLFERLGFIDAGELIDRDSAERAVHCLQFLVDASVASPEYQLVLNKLVCGVKPGYPICRSIELSDDEREQLEGLLHAVTRHWKALENTSIDGLRESFLQRNGRLQLKNDAWHLAIEARAFDMLLDQVPWSFSTIKFAWMERVIYVEWR